jgi:hypothetical protein
MITVILGLVINGVLDVPFIMFFDSIGLNASYGAVMADLVGYSISIFMALFVLEKKYKFRYRETLKLIPKYIISWIVFVLVIFLMKMVIPNEVGSRLLEIPVLMLFGIVSFGIYFVISYMNGNLEMVFGSRIKGIFKKFKRN